MNWFGLLWESAVGGGSFPGASLATSLVSLMPGAIGANALALKLRLGDPSIIVRIVDDSVVLDPRTLPVGSFRDLGLALEQALAE